MRRIALVALFAACGGDSNKPDAPPAAAMITISGTATARDASGSTPLAGVTIGAYSNTDENTPVTTATTDAQGNFTLTVMTGGTALDGYLKATIASYMDTYLYPPTALGGDFSGATVVMLKPDTFDLLANTLCGANQMTTNGAIAAEVEDGSGAFVAGATVSSNPAANKYCYNASNFPSKNATATDTDGLGYMFNVTGTATVSASKSGLTFQSHPLKARAGALTTTLITP
jgi:hypothetical protein